MGKGFLLTCLLLVLTGCSLQNTVTTRDPSVNLYTMQKLHVLVTQKDKHRVHSLIAKKLATMGFEVTSGPDTPVGVDAVVTYEAKWRSVGFWTAVYFGITPTPYLWKIEITIRNPETRYAFASGQGINHKAAWSRALIKPAHSMIDETIEKIYGRRIKARAQ